MSARMAAPIRGRAGYLARVWIMAAIGLRMMAHDRLKTVGTLLGVVFATVLSFQQLGTFLGLLQKNTMLADNVAADLWVTPRGLPTLQDTAPMSMSVLYRARTAPGVAWAEPMLYGGAAAKVPGGTTEAMTVIGTRLPRGAGGPWNIVAGATSDLAWPDAMFFDDNQRDKLGGLNLGSVREVNGHRVRAVGFTWGLQPFGPPYAFADFDTARSLLRIASDQTHFVLAGVAPGRDVESVRAELQARLPDAEVLTKAQMQQKIVRYLLTQSSLGISFGTSTLFALIVGFVIVGLTMFSAVVDNLREFGTLKAIGATNGDLALVLLVQSVVFALAGSLVGLTLATKMADGIRSADLALVLPPWLFGATLAAMVVMCVTASSLALLRVRGVEPGMVFR
jgi:putative ABC transport system permease protein